MQKEYALRYTLGIRMHEIEVLITSTTVVAWRDAGFVNALHIVPVLGIKSFSN